MGRASQNSLPREMYVAFYRDSCLNCGSRRQLSHGPWLPGEFFWVLHSPLPNSLALYSEGPEHRRFVGATWGRVWDPVPIHSGYLPSALQWICSSMDVLHMRGTGLNTRRHVQVLTGIRTPVWKTPLFRLFVSVALSSRFNQTSPDFYLLCVILRQLDASISTGYVVRGVGLSKCRL